ncbi:MAG: DNA replication/repair protein RecF [Candidatus Kapaibacteriota bacterium]
MHIKQIFFENIRNHKQTKLIFEPNLNLFFGPNGSGKTSILEAISLGTFSKSFVTKFDQNIVRNSTDYYVLEITIETENQTSAIIYILYTLGKTKVIRQENGKLITAQNLIGRFPSVILAPDMRGIVFGAPSFRREFVDRIIAQTDKVYLNKLYELRRILKQRNKLLLDIAKGNSSGFDLLEIWTQQLIDTSVFIIKSRGDFIVKFATLFSECFSELTNSKEVANLFYSPFSNINFNNELLQNNYPTELIYLLLKSEFEKYEKKELERGITLFGPHRDDFIILLNNNLASSVASQGQSKSILVALKYAELNYLKNLKGTKPIVLLDDIFSELDLSRVNQVLNILNNLDLQLFITLTDIDQIKPILFNFETCGLFRVENGIVSKLDQLHKSKV